jgi:hypothetical protein
VTAEPADATAEPLSEQERRIIGEAGVALFRGRLIVNAQPPIDDVTLAEIAGRCVGSLPDALVELWRTAFGGRLDYDLRADLGGQDVALSFHELFYPDSDGYHDLWGWIAHERDLAAQHQPDWSGRLAYLPIGGFEYAERVYVHTGIGPDHGTVVCWQEGLPPGWELRPGDRAGLLATDLHSLFRQLGLEQDPWESDADSGTRMRNAIDDLLDSGDPQARVAGAKLRRLVQAAVLDWRTALERGRLRAERRLRRLALDHAATHDDVALLQRLIALGCNPSEEVRASLTPIDIALLHRAFAVVTWLLDQHVPVDNCLRVGAHAVDLDLAHDLLRRGALVDTSTIWRALDNPDIEVVQIIANAAPPADDLQQMGLRLRMLAAQANIASQRATATDGSELAHQQQRRATVLTELANRFDPGGRRRRDGVSRLD